MPAAEDTEEREPVRVSVFDAKGNHVVTSTRNRDGDYLASTTAPVDDVVITASDRATLYQSFYKASLDQKLPPETILKLLRVHSYDVDFKQRVRPGDLLHVYPVHACITASLHNRYLAPDGREIARLAAGHGGVEQR